MEFFDLEGKGLHAVVAVVALFIVLGLLAAGFALSAGGTPDHAHKAVKTAVNKARAEERPASIWAGPLRLPTSNVALFKEDGGPDFFQYTTRTFEGRSWRPWRGGKYGFVRTPVRTDEGVFYTRFHEGIDIQAMQRDERGEPLDTVRTVDRGLVAYVNDVAAASNYGKYVVVEHQWDGAPYYSLYAHLSRVLTKTGRRIQQGTALGRMGHTGAGINRRRAHVHLEFNVLINDHFQRWIDKYFGGNVHGVYSGLNMRGFDPAAYLEALRKNPDLTVTTFIKNMKPYYKIAFPRNGPLDLLRRYPWMRPTEGTSTPGVRPTEGTSTPGVRPTEGTSTPGVRPDGGSRTMKAQAWEMSFTRGGFPLKVEPYDKDISQPTVTMDPPVKDVPCSYLTYDHLRGTAPGCTLAPRGKRYIDLIRMQGANETSNRAW